MNSLRPRHSGAPDLTAATGLAVAALAGLVVALIWGLGQVLGILSPVPGRSRRRVIALPIGGDHRHKRVPRTRAILFVFALALVLVAG
jgi:hypothetical protein